jgi:hypothetical protein
MNGQIRKLGTRYDKVAEKSPRKPSERAKAGNPATTRAIHVSEAQRHFADVAGRYARMIEIRLAVRDFPGAYGLVSEAQREMTADVVFRPSSMLVDVLEMRLANILEERRGCETLLHLSSLAAADVEGIMGLGSKAVVVIRNVLALAGLHFKDEVPVEPPKQD